MMTLAVLFLSSAGFAALALSMQRHHRTLFGKPPQRGRALLLRCGGWSLLAVALVPAIGGHGVSIGIVLQFGVATLAALAVALGLTYGLVAKAKVSPLRQQPPGP